MTTTTTVPVTAHPNPTGGLMDNGFELVCLLRGPRARGSIPDTWPEGFRNPKSLSYDDPAHLNEIINRRQEVPQKDIANEVTNWFLEVDDDRREQVKNLILISDNADWEQHPVANELVDFQKQLNNKKQVLVELIGSTDITMPRTMM